MLVEAPGAARLQLDFLTQRRELFDELVEPNFASGGFTFASRFVLFRLAKFQLLDFGAAPGLTIGEIDPKAVRRRASGQPLANPIQELFVAARLAQPLAKLIQELPVAVCRA